MKNFFTSFFATISALLVFLIGGVILAFVMLGVLIALGQKKPVAVEEGSYLVFDLSATIMDTPDQAEGMEEFLEALGGDSRSRLQLRQVTRAIEAAAHDKAIKGLFLTGSVQGGGYGSGFAALKEVRETVAAFKASGKPVKAYLNMARTRDLYLASLADDLALDPYGVVFMPGLASQPMFFTGAFEKFGIGVQVTRVGKYKSGIEPYTRKDMSPENREQIQKLIDDLWKDLTVAVQGARKLPEGALQKVVDEKGMIRADVAKQAGLVDRIAYLDEVLDELKADTGRKGSSRPFKQINLKEYARLVSASGLTARRAGEGKTETSSDKGRIAIVYTEGEIVDGHGNEEGYVYGAKTARLLRQIRQDDAVKAVVLRVNSPGGSVTGSEAIAREVRLLQEKKPVVVSMGAYAASGGYWISAPASRIFAEPTTVTGSIGVYGVLLNFQGLLNDKLGLTFDTVKTGRYADALTITRPKTPEEMAIIQDSVDWVYDQFITKVTEERKLERKTVEEIAQGRVWSGSEALKLGLVDELGGLAAAVKHAAAEAKLGDGFRVSEYPRPKQFAEALTEAIEGRHREKALGGPAGVLMGEALAELQALGKFNDPQGVYARLPFDLRLQ
ncbi:signal peptide peptidase SppA [Oleiharenicola lentus]|uniref:Signal peptide peptidase SppA n=1 Tax=Oleiharenicola lentus TaxID=2508720 RepID=A0A4Q1C9D4_9BACT|nr:signal peptide peptidase SppA [Oleiharenicola lentus]RXK55558.1 signal peptide peptidase SppA [Oleiharenicola lentus]